MAGAELQCASVLRARPERADSDRHRNYSPDRPLILSFLSMVHVCTGPTRCPMIGSSSATPARTRELPGNPPFGCAFLLDKLNRLIPEVGADGRVLAPGFSCQFMSSANINVLIRLVDQVRLVVHILRRRPSCPDAHYPSGGVLHCPSHQAPRYCSDSVASTGLCPIFTTNSAASFTGRSIRYLCRAFKPMT